MLINVGIDSGFGFCLAKSNNKEVIVSNFIKKIDEDDAYKLAININNLNEDNLIVHYDDNYYVVGKLAVKADPKLKRHATNDRINNEYHLIEILSVMGMMATSRNFDVNLVVGLPNKLRNKKQDMVTWLQKKWKFSYLTKSGEIERIIEVKNCACIEQPLSAIYELSQDDIDALNIVSIDLGHSTADAIYISEGIPSINSNDWLSFEGVKRCYEKLRIKLIKEFQTQYGIYDILERELQQAIETGYFKVKQNNIDVTEIVHEVFDEYSEYVAMEVEDNYSDYLPNADYVITSGGIMCNDYFTKVLAERFKKFQINFARFENPQKSIVNGMYNLANLIFEDDNKESDVDNG